jgi:hypothetical protein
MATTEKIIIEIDVVNNTLKDTEDKIKKVSGALVKMRGDEKANEKQVRATEAELRLLNKTYREQDRVLQASIKANNAAEGSLEQLKAQYVVAQAALNKMSAEQRENTQEGKEQIAEVGRLNAKLKEIESSYGQNARNVGNYTEAVKPLKQQLRELTQQLQQLEMQGQGNSEEFRKLSAEAGNIKDTMGDVNNTIKALASDTSLVDGVAAGISGIAGAFSAAQGAAALFGEEGEDLQKTLVKIQATMAIANGVQQVANALQKDSAAMIALNNTRMLAAAAAQATYATVVGTSTGVLRVFRIAAAAAVSATGIGAIIIALVTLYENWDKVNKLIDDGVEYLKKYKTALIILAPVIIALFSGLILIAGAIKGVNALLKSGSDEAGDYTKRIDLLNEALDKGIDIEKKKRDVTVNALEDIIKIRKAQGISDKEAAALDNNLLKVKLKNIDDEIAARKIYAADNQAQQDKIMDLDKQRADLITANTLSNIENYKKETKAKEDALKALADLENKLLGDTAEQRTKILTEQYAKDYKLLQDSKAAGLLIESQYLTDLLALNTNYQNQLRLILTQEAQFQKDLNAELIANQDTTNQEQLLKNQEAEALSFEEFQKYTADRLAVSDAEAKQLEDNAKVYTDIFTQQADLINKAFTESITASGIDLKRFSKQVLAIAIDTIEKVVLARQAAAIAEATAASLASPQSVATGGIAGIAQAALLTGIIKAAFAVFKATVIGSFEKGGEIKAANGMLVGNSHAQGGIKIGTPRGMIEAEGGEVIINKRSTAMFKPILSAINEAGGGVKFADGGAIFAPTVNNDMNAIADMFAKMPNPVVSVVDINAVQSQVNQVQAVATL